MLISRRYLLGGIGAGTFCVASPVSLHAQSNSNFFRKQPKFSNTSNIGPPHKNASLAMKIICDAVGIERSITLFSGNIAGDVTAFATVRDGSRYIVYDADKLPWPETKTPWSSMWVMGHEVGHHVASHVFRNDTPDKAQELEADRFAGFALSRLGATEAQALSRFSWDWPESDTHPAAKARREATRLGWLLGERMKRRERRN